MQQIMRKRINLIYPEKSNIKFEIITFPDGEPHFKFKEELNRKEEYSIITRICNPTDLFILMQVGRILNRQGIIFDITISYLMSMRMDRVISFNEDFSLELVANLINSLNADRVSIYEPHSFRALQLIKNSQAINITTSLAKSHIKYTDVICFPDKGAYDRYYSSFSSNQCIILEKKRDLDTGRILSLEIKEDSIYSKFEVKRIVVIDDLCDGGGTFILSANKLREVFPEAKLIINVCHVVNPKGIKAIAENYDEVYTTNTYKDWEVDYQNIHFNPCV